MLDLFEQEAQSALILGIGIKVRPTPEKLLTLMGQSLTAIGVVVCLV
jgi:hypothetical protein